MKISEKNQVAIIVFISTLSALLPGISNQPLAIIPCLIIIFFKYNSGSLTKIRRDNLFLYWILYFGIFLILSFNNFLLFGNKFNISQSIFLSFTYIVYIYTFSTFSYQNIRDGVIKGSIPMLSYILFVELPLKIINPSILLNIREFINLRPISPNTLLGFFEEASHFPSIGILIITVFGCLILDKEINKFKTYIKNLYKSFFLIALSHISGSFLISFYLPILSFITITYLKNLIVKLKIKKFEKRLAFILFLVSSFILFYIPYIIRKISFSLSYDHSTSTRFLSLIGGLNDFIRNPIFGVGAGFSRFTREESINQLINSSPSGNLKIILQNIYASSGLENYYTMQGFPVYSLIGYLLSETGIFSLIFIFSYFLVIRKSIKYINNTIEQRFSINYLLTIIVNLSPLSYFIYMLYGYPRALPYFIITNILVLKRITKNLNNFKK